MAVAAAATTGCSVNYNTPGGAASFRALGITAEQADSLTDQSIAEQLDRKPLAGFPTAIAVVRLQESGYRSCTAEGWGAGRFSVVSTRDVEADTDFERLAGLPMIAGLAPLNRLVIPDKINSERDLRRAAAGVQADMLLIYTFDTKFNTETKLAPMGVVTLGLFPDREARVTSTASAVLVDTRNGYVYALAEGTDQETQLANAWTSRTAVDESRRRAERTAFKKMVANLEQTWQGVVSRYGPGIKDELRTSADQFSTLTE
jgi:hypothetical protein